MVQGECETVYSKFHLWLPLSAETKDLLSLLLNCVWCNLCKTGCVRAITRAGDTRSRPNRRPPGAPAGPTQLWWASPRVPSQVVTVQEAWLSTWPVVQSQFHASLWFGPQSSRRRRRNYRSEEQITGMASRAWEKKPSFQSCHHKKIDKTLWEHHPALSLKHKNFFSPSSSGSFSSPVYEPLSL